MFGAGWLAGLAVLGAVVLLIAGPSTASSGGELAAWVGWLKLVLGVLALLLAVRQWRSQPAEGAESSSSAHPAVQYGIASRRLGIRGVVGPVVDHGAAHQQVLDGGVVTADQDPQQPGREEHVQHRP